MSRSRREIASPPSIVPDKVEPVRSTRVRASERAIKAALNAIRGAGLAVHKVCVTGGQVEIHCGSVEGGTTNAKGNGLEKW